MSLARLRRLSAVSDGLNTYEAYEVMSKGLIEALNPGPSVIGEVGEIFVMWQGRDGSRLLQLRLDRERRIIQEFHMGAIPNELWDQIRMKNGVDRGGGSEE